jgi:hypothetical protein
MVEKEKEDESKAEEGANDEVGKQKMKTFKTSTKI